MGVQLKKGDLVISPIDTNEIAAGKEYRVLAIVPQFGFKIKDNQNRTLYCKTLQCGHIEDNDWIIK